VPSTKTNLRIARLLNKTVVCARRLVGKNNNAQVKRKGIEWRLDLDEGIDLAIYLGVYQRVPDRVRTRWIKPGSLVIDIGANIGAFSLPIAGDVGEGGCVVAVEPTDFAFAKLVRNAGLNPGIASRLVAVQAGLTDGKSQPEVSAFYSRWPLDGETDARHPKHLGQAETAASARFLSLDALVAELREARRISGAVSFIKLDVDGHELAVLRGSERVFTTDRPALLIEIAPYVQDEVPGRFEALLATLSGFGYVLERSTTGEALPMSTDALRSIIGAGAGIDILARPADRQDSIRR
jgi:FkbM family methyltransferase